MKTLFLLLCFSAYIVAEAAPTVIAGPITNLTTGNTYYLLSIDNWTNSEIAAVRLGGHLATINDAAEDAWVYSTFSSNGATPQTLWIGLNDAATEGTFVWASGEALTYRAWGPGEPNNIGNEDFVCYFPPDYQYRGTWNDCAWSAECNGVVEIDFVGPTNCIGLPSRLVSWWNADGSGADGAGRNHGTLRGGTSFATGRHGQAFAFDGIDDRVDVSDSDTFKLTSLTLEAWIYITGLPYEPQNFFGVAAVFFRGDDRGGLDPLSILIKPNGHLEFNVQAPDGQLTVLEAPVMTNQWIHVAGTLEDTTGAMKLYLNGTLAAETVTSGRPVTDLIGANPGVGIGNSQPGSSFRFPFNGLIDELRLYSRALSQQEIQGIYTAKAICHLSLDIQLYPGLTIVGPVGSSYHLQYTEGLSSTNAWYALTNFVLPTSPYFFLDTTVSGKERRYYRAFLLP